MKLEVRFVLDVKSDRHLTEDEIRDLIEGWARTQTYNMQSFGPQLGYTCVGWEAHRIMEKAHA